MTKQKVIVLGANGMLGSMVLDVFLRDENVVTSATLRNEKEIKELQKKYPKLKIKALDVEEATESDLARIIRGYSWVINCIGLIKPYIHDDNPIETERAIRINSLYPHLLAKAAEKVKAKVIQIETDCVYSGQKGGYTESDQYDPLDVYGKTKSLGEVHSPIVYHLRDSIIGPEPKAHVSLMDWFLTQPKNAKVNGFSNHKWNGVTTYHFAKICLGIIKKNLKINGVQHVIAVDEPSKAKMLEYFAKYFNRGDIKITVIKESKSIDITLATNNPEINLKLWQGAGYKSPPRVEEMIKELAEFLRDTK